MTRLLCATAADVREAASYAPKEAMPMSNQEAISLLVEIRNDDSHAWTYAAMEALDLAIAALRAQPEPGPQRDCEAEIAILTKQRDASEAARCETVNDYRDATDRADRLWKIVAMLQDLLDAKEAGL